MYSEKTNKVNKVNKAITSFLLFSFLFTQLLTAVPVSVSANNTEELPVCDPTVNLVKNGSFENPVVNDSWDIFSSIADWSIAWVGGADSFGSSTRPAQPMLEIQKNVSGWLPSEGLQYAELDTDWDGPSGSLYGEPSSVSIWQNLETVSGVTYKLSFDFSARPETVESNNVLEVKWNSVVVSGTPLSVSGESNSNTDWNNHTFEIVADSENTELRFTDLGNQDSLGTFIDNIVVNCVPVETPDPDPEPDPDPTPENPIPVCLIPNASVDSLEDVTEEEIGTPYVAGELTLDEIIENAGYLGVDVLADQTQYQIWQSEKDNTSINVKFLDEYTAQNFVFGYYEKGDVNSFTPVFRSGEVSEYASTTEFIKGQNINLNIENLDKIGFAIFTASGKHLFTTENSLNGGEDHALVYHLSDNEYILGFEDMLLDASDKDYQDVVVLVTVLSCSFDEQNTPPTINLVGADPLEIILGSDFTDPGATATDLEDGDLTSEIIVDGTVSTTTLGTYTLTYSVYDSEGLGATTTREVVVYEESNPPANTPPVITLIDGDPLQWQLNTPFVDPGATATDLEDGDATTTANIITTGTVNASTTGSYILTYSVTDSGGLSDSITREVNVVDNTTPPVEPPVTPPGGGGGGGGIGGHRRDVSNLFAPQGEILGATSCLYLIDYVKIDWKNDPIEVLKVQSFLNVFEGESLSLTGNFDQTTFDAVARFQTKYASDILTPWGDNVTTGFVYILTKKKINEIYCNTLYPLSQADQNEINAFRVLGGSNANSSSFTGNNSATDYLFAPDNTSNINGSKSGLNGVLSDNADSPIVELKDNASTSDSVLRNVAVSLFAFPQRMFDRLFGGQCGGVSLLLFLILLAVLIAVIKLLTNSKNSNIPVAPIAKVSDSKEPPVIVLPGVLPDEEIVVENPEEGSEEGVMDLR